MKKLIVISVIFALVTGSAFAADVSVEVFGSANLLQGSNAQEEYTDSDGNSGKFRTVENTTSFGIGRVRIGASGQVEDGTLGGWLRYDAGGSASGFVWWKPSDLIKLQIGANPDGEFGLDGVARWGFYQLAGEVVVKADNAWGNSSWAWSGLDANFSSAFYGGWGEPGIVLNITPVDALAINLGIPLGAGGSAYRVYKQTTIQAKYNIDGVGTAGITYIGNLAEEDPVLAVSNIDPTDSAFDEKAPIGFSASNDSPQIIAYFGLTSIENVGIDIGIGYKFGDTYSKTDSATKIKTTESVNEPFAVGAGVNFSSGLFGLKARVLGQFGGSMTYEYEDGSTKIKETLSTGTAVLFDVLPSYAVNDKLTVYLSAGIGLLSGVEELYYKLDSNGAVEIVNNTPQFTHKTLDSVTAWHVEPYISLTPSYWSATFFAGFRLESKGAKDVKDNTIVNWSIPIGITCSF